MVTPRYRLSTVGIHTRVVPPSSAQGCTGRTVAAAVQDVLTAAATDSADATTWGGPALVVGAIPFDSRRPPMLYTPQTVRWRHRGPGEASSGPGGRPTQTCVCPAGSADYCTPPDDQGYRDSVARAVHRIREGQLDKVVLARTMTVEGEQPVDTGALLERLAAANPGAYTYRVDLPRGTGRAGTMIGASPELVLSSARGEVCSHPLAGSVARTGDPVADRRLGEELLHSPKDLAEHSHAARAVAESFRRHAEVVSVPDEPALVETPVLLHLGTRITGTLRDGTSPLELLYDLHPTPAVCGWPAGPARSLIEELEDFDRGMYAGLVGWIDAEGTSEWALALRGGLVSGPTTTLYAGAGIVADSDPDAEHAETATKFRTFADHLFPDRLSERTTS
ncbi:isochorismate synthase [Corynebacterium neomassiliense]|uniref:isochorismate synthase n=1 Tax=Corynebacterium neomassiliense TaxID=2079482 RepID=UPI001386C561|nr:isochorismate synthase [Corynebacterium neomassiliense]